MNDRTRQDYQPYPPTAFQPEDDDLVPASQPFPPFTGDQARGPVTTAQLSPGAWTQPARTAGLPAGQGRTDADPSMAGLAADQLQQVLDELAAELPPPVADDIAPDPPARPAYSAIARAQSAYATAPAPDPVAQPPRHAEPFRPEPTPAPRVDAAMTDVVPERVAEQPGPPGGDALPAGLRGEDWGAEWDASRNKKAFKRAHRHSGRVRRLRIALPLIGLFIVSGLAGAYFISQSGLESVVIEKTTIEGGKLVMKNPALDGVDKDQRPYKLSAREALQDPRNLKQIELDSIKAQVPIPEGLYANITAGTGFYDDDAKQLRLGGEVDVVTDDGMSANLQDADIDLGAGSLKTQNPVAFATEQAKISADSMFVEDNGKRVVFEKRVKMTIYPDKIRELQQKQEQADAAEGSQGDTAQ
ncbi:MAG: LPS export ABC transporter periplasmic protein LptC [Nitratireductor sp.]|nr:LPS export ABC transporter periplasmic protein LptC [Nitratireductor sp.]